MPLVFALAACSSDPITGPIDAGMGGTDASSTTDASGPSDSGSMATPTDAAALPDAEPVGLDAGAGNLADASFTADAGQMGAPDAGDTFDAGFGFPVRFAADVQPIFDRHCTNSGCHGPGTGIDLTSAAVSHADLVNHVSEECAGTMRVAPGDPTRSYLVHKIEGTGPCFMGARMPMSAQPLTPAEVEVIAGWIAGGALND